MIAQLVTIALAAVAQAARLAWQVMPADPLVPHLRSLRLPVVAMRWLNWFVPVQACAIVLAAWAAAMVALLVVLPVLRWARIVQ